MKNLYNLDGIKTQLSLNIRATKARLEAWEAVTFPTKKDGSPFKVLSKNIDGATLYTEQYAMQPGENKLRVLTWADGSGYISSEIDVYCLVRYLKDEKKLAKTENYMPKITYLEQVYRYDLEDIKEAVAAKIDHLRAELAALEAAATLADTAYSNFRKAIGAALEALEKETAKDENSTLFYMIKDTVINRYPYC